MGDLAPSVSHRSFTETQPKIYFGESLTPDPPSGGMTVPQQNLKADLTVGHHLVNKLTHCSTEGKVATPRWLSKEVQHILSINP